MQSSLNPEEDYLDEDNPLKHAVKRQNFCVLSMLTPNSFPESKREQFKDQKILGIKVRGVFESYDDAKKRADILQKQDRYHNIFIGEVGKWLPFNADVSTMETEDDPVYREQALNQYMKAYKDALKEEEVEEKDRKEQTLKGNNAKIVTGMTDAPATTGLGCPEITPPGIVPKSEQSTDYNTSVSNSVSNSVSDNEKVINVENSNKDDIDEQIKLAQNDKLKIMNELADSKTNIKELEAKLSAISQIYSDLKK